MSNTFQVVRDFEKVVAEYTNAKYCVSIDSCSNALFLCCKYLHVEEVTIPKHTYLSVPCSIINAGGSVKFEDDEWFGIYQLKPYQIYDCALRFRRNMYLYNSFMCLSFHHKKHLNIGKGGAILCDDVDAYNWFKKARFNGRSECRLEDDNINMIGWNMYMTPEQASRGLYIMEYMQDFNYDKVEQYPDLSKYAIYS